MVLTETPRSRTAIAVLDDITHRSASSVSETKLHLRDGDVEVRRIAAGDPSAPTLVLLHEGLGSVSTWHDVPERLANATGAGVFVFSRLGYGKSSPIALPRPIRFLHDEATRLRELLDVAQLDRVILVGHSDGASIALIAAMEGDPRILGLALLSPHVFVEDVSVESIAKIAELYRTTDLRERLARHHGDNVDIAFRGWNEVWLDPAFRRWDIRGELSRVRVPTLVVQGRDDQYGTLLQVDAIVRGASSSVTALVLPSCGHTPQRDRPNETLGAIVDFVAHVRETLAE